jgi:hypothetical protein
MVEPTTTSKPIPIVLDIEKLRDGRQRINNMLAFDSIQKKDLTKNVNVKEFERVQTEMEMTREELYDKCIHDSKFGKLLSMCVSINASRQGTKDEELQIQTCSITTEKCGITIKKLNTIDFRPTKTGKIITNKEFKQNDISKNDCLKSFDAKITGKKNGWVYAKVVFGNGGHQDNVFEETHTFCEWVLQYGEKSELFVILIDTNLTAKFDELKEKYTNIDNLVIGNHITVQQYFIDNYYTLEELL